MSVAKKAPLGTLSLVMITIAGLVNLRDLPLLASTGVLSITFYSAAALLFFIPSAMACAELASGWPKAGGVYLWVREAFGPLVGVIAMWLEWINNVISMPATLSFLCATLLYLFVPNLFAHKGLLCILMLCFLWGITLFNFAGIHIASRLNMLGSLCGTLLPTCFIILFAGFWLWQGNTSLLQFSWPALLPSWHFNNIAFFIGALSGYAGVQVAAFHITDVKDPRRMYPRAIFISVLLILAVTMLGSLAIAMVVPTNNVSLVSGLMQCFSAFLTTFHLQWLLPVVMLLIVISSLSTLSAWVLGPARGMQAAAERGDFLRIFAKSNQQEAPVAMLLLQGGIGTLLIMLFIWLPSIKSAFWLLMVLSSQLTLIMYALIFAAVIRLRYSQPNVSRHYRIPGRLGVVWLIMGFAILTCCLGIAVSFVPPTQLQFAHRIDFDYLIIAGDVVYLIIPILIYHFAGKKTAR